MIEFTMAGLASTALMLMSPSPLEWPGETSSALPAVVEASAEFELAPPLMAVREGTWQCGVLIYSGYWRQGVEDAGCVELEIRCVPGESNPVDDRHGGSWECEVLGELSAE